MAETETTRRDRSLAATIVLAGGIALSLIAFQIVQHNEIDRRQLAFEELAQPIADSIADHLHSLSAEVDSIHRLFDSSVHVSRDEFHDFTKSLPAKRKEIHNLAWIPRVRGEERERYEAEARKEGWTGFHITEKGTDGEPVQAGNRPEYFPVYYLEPYRGNEALAGLDLAFSASPALWASFEQARDQNRTVVTPAQPSGNTGSDLQSFFILQPAYRRGSATGALEERRNNLEGFILATFRMPSLLKSVIPLANRSKMTLEFRDITTSPQEQNTQDTIRSADPLSFERHFSFGGRNWAVLCRSEPDFMAMHPLSTCWFVLGVGLLIALLLAGLMAVREQRLNYFQSLLKDQDIPALKKAIRIRWRIMGPVALALLLSALSFLGWFQKDMTDDETEKTRIYALQAESSWNLLVDLNLALLRENMDIAVRNPDLMAAFSAKDRPALLKSAQELYPYFREASSITHFYFINPDRSCFLRAHHPTRFGDVITRFSLREAVRVGHDTWGIEVGSLGTFTLRYIWPWKIKSTIVGFLELGMEFKAIEKSVHNLLGVEVITMLNKEATSRKAFEAGRTAGLVSGSWDAFPNYLVLNQTITDVPSQLDVLLRQNAAKNGSQVFRLKANGHVWSCGVIQVRDIADAYVANLIILRDITKQETTWHWTLLIVLSCTAGLGCLLLMGISVVIGRVERDLAVAVATRELETQARFESEERLTATLRSIGDGVISTDAQGQVLSLNTIAETLTGWNGLEAQGRPIQDVLHIINAQTEIQCTNPVDRVLREGRIVGLANHTVLISRDGTKRQISDSAAPILSAEGRIIGVVLVFRDVSEEYRIQDELRISRERFDQIAEQSREMIWEVDAEGLFTYVSHACNSMLGYRDEEIVGRLHFYDLHPAEGREQFREEFFEAFKKNECFTDLPTDVETKDGRILHVLTNAMPILGANNQLRGYRGSDRDITEQKQAVNQLLHSQKLESVGHLAAGIAHEINTPTQFVGDNTRFLKDSFASLLQLIESYEKIQAPVPGRPEDDARRAEMENACAAADFPYLRTEIPKAFEQSLEGIQRISNIVRAMKEFSHPGGAEKTAISINRAIETTATVARNEWKYVADLQLDLDTQLPLVNCIAGDINQVILNLIVNAAHAIEEKTDGVSKGKGLITVSTKTDADCVEIRVTDTGAGIAEKHRKRIFDPFFTTKSVGKGTGQGLTISFNTIVKKHGGTIRFETEVGRGTTFFVRLPIAESK
ncbi:MAG TPA: hypothetical protein DCZ95_14880 [Verrucomicrobia bacterium]|nr:MAG: hypothetical protein A2X46_18015 [Lentisphaerae bacterium GWF2_57_35]HBA85369.1 hypothetical protein [Verrucomicrobiota bacterium]